MTDNAGTCPKCGAQKDSGSTDIFKGNNYILLHTCKDCGCYWKDIYKFDHAEEEFLD